MKLEDGQIVTLDNNKDYIIVKQVEFESETYMYLITAKKPIEVMIVKAQYINDKTILSIVDSEEELEKIINLFEK